MVNKLKVALLALAFSLASSGQNFTLAAQLNSSQLDQVETVIIELTLAGYQQHQLSWTPLTGTGFYSVMVLDMTTNSLHTQLSTSSTSCNLYGLVPGHQYRFSVTKASETLILELTIGG